MAAEVTPMLAPSAASRRGAQPVVAGSAALILCLLVVQQSSFPISTYQPASLRWPGWLGSFPKPGMPRPPSPPQPAALGGRPPQPAALPVGGPDDWRDNIQYGFHPAEAKVPEDEEQDAMRTLIQAAGGGTAVPAVEALSAVERQKERSKRITQARVEASTGASPEKIDSILHPCEEHPSDLRCSEYPSGMLTPEFDKAKYGPNIKVPNGAIRNVEGSAEDTDERRRSAPESEYEYEVRSLSANYEDQESPQRRRKDGYHDRIDAEDPMAQLQDKRLKPLHTYMKARYGPGIKMVNMKKAADHQGIPKYPSNGPQRRTPEYWKAKYGAYGVYPFHRGDSDDTMGFAARAQAPRLGQEYFKAKYGANGYAMFDLNAAANKEAESKPALPVRQWHAEAIVRPTEYEE